MEEALRTRLLGDAGLAGLVGRRVDWGLRAGSDLPAVRLLVVSAPRSYTYSGRSDLVPYRVQADCFGRTYGAAKQTARAVERALDGLRGGGFDSVFLDAERDGDDSDAAGDPMHRTSLDFRIWHHTTL